MTDLRDIRIKGYTILEEIGRGAQSVIFRARSMEDGREVAIKHVSRAFATNNKVFEHIANEYAVGKKLLKAGPHPGIVRFYGLQRKRKLFRIEEANLIMDFLPGATLDERTDYALFDLLDVFLQVADALAFMHDNGFLHMDIKPENIIISPGLKATVIDLGFACPVGVTINAIKGTRAYLAPEQVEGRKLDERTDVYNLGATIYKVLTGSPLPLLLPPARHQRGEFLTHKRLKAPHVSDVNPGIPREIGDVIMAMCKRDRLDRPSSMAVVIEMLERACASLPRKQVV